MDVPALVAIIVFYILIVLAGVWAARATRHRKSGTKSDTIVVGGRDIGILLGIFTLTASWIGGGAINGTAETVYSPHYGLLWATGPAGFGISLIVNGLVFVKEMRKKNYVTVLDPLQAKLGKIVGTILFLVELTAGTLYGAAILNALGGTIEVVTGLARIPSVAISAAIAALYTMLGGIYSVAYTDVIQLLFMILGLVIAIPFAFTNDAVSSITETFETRWSGTWDSSVTGTYIDTFLLTIMGGIPIQAAYQRMLSAESTRTAQTTAVIAGVFSSLMTLPPLLLGAVAASTDWSLTGYMNGTATPAEMGEERLILPLVLQYLTPTAVSLFGLGAVTAAVMSSIDSAMLSIGSLFGKNVFQGIIKPSASEREIVWVIRGTIVVIATASAAIAVAVNSIMGLYFMCADFLYVVTFPQFVSVLYLDPNCYGSLAGIVVGVTLRLGGGDYFISWVPAFHYAGGLNFPLKTASMLSCLVVTNVVSFIVKYLFQNGYIPKKFDYLDGTLSRRRPGTKIVQNLEVELSEKNGEGSP